DPRQDRADNAADPVDAKDIKAFVDAQPGFQADDEPHADKARSQTDDNGAHGANETSRRSDANQTGNRPRNAAQQRGMTAEQPLTKGPGQRSGGGRDRGVQDRHGSGAGGLHVRASVEAEPADPQQAAA